MGSRSMGEWLLRPSTLSRMTTTTSPAWTTSRRAFTSSPPSNAEKRPSPPASQPQSEPAKSPQPKEDPFSGLLGSKPRFRTVGRQQQTTRSIDNLFASTNDPRFNRNSRTGYASRKTDSSDQFAAAQRTFGSEFTKGVRAQRKPLDFGAMLSPDGLPVDFDQQPVKPAVIPESEKVYPRLNPSYGRTIQLDPTKGRDLVRGVAMLGSLVSRNKLRRDFNKQKFHERPGLKRKRLNSERWRAKFNAGFRKVAARVTELTRKGW